jgi:hypothetical protein
MKACCLVNGLKILVADLLESCYYEPLRRIDAFNKRESEWQKLRAVLPKREHRFRLVIDLLLDIVGIDRIEGYQRLGRWVAEGGDLVEGLEGICVFAELNRQIERSLNEQTSA